MFRVGDLADAYYDGEFPDYKDVIQAVKVVRVVGDEYKCRILAFPKDGPFTWHKDYLRKPRNEEPPRVWSVGDRVEFRMRGRKLKGETAHLDGLASTTGVWVVGTVWAVSNDEGIVEHPDWDTATQSKGRTYSRVVMGDMRAHYA